MSHYLECGSGWAKLYEPLIARCEAEGATIAQIKEKFGGLRFYVHSCSDELYEAIAEAEKQSHRVCEECGEPGVVRIGGWLKTLCDTHAEERKAAAWRKIGVSP